MRAMGARRGRLSAPWPRFHGVDRADVYIIIHVRACCCGECELNPPPSPPIPRRRSSLTPPHSDTPFPSTSAPPRSPDARRQAARCIPRRPTTPSPPTAQPILRRRPSLAPAQRHALAEHFRSPTQPRRTPTDCAMHSPPTAHPIPRRRPSPAPHSDTPSPSTSAPHAARRTPAGCAMHSPPTSPPIPAEDFRSPPHSDTPFPSTSARPRSADARPQAARCIPRRRPSLAPAQRHALAEHFRPPRSADARPRSADARPQAARCTPADRTTHSPQRNAASPSVPLRTQKNGTAQCMCDAECLGRPSLRSVIGVGEPRAVRRRFGALAWRVGLRPQPWALRSRRCGRVLRA